MKDHVKYSRARDQLYHYKVGVRQHHDNISPHRRTPELVQLMEMVEALVEAVCVGLENHLIVAMQLESFSLTPLPGLEDMHEEMKRAAKFGDADS